MGERVVCRFDKLTLALLTTHRSAEVSDGTDTLSVEPKRPADDEETLVVEQDITDLNGVGKGWDDGGGEHDFDHVEGASGLDFGAVGSGAVDQHDAVGLRAE